MTTGFDGNGGGSGTGTSTSAGNGGEMYAASSSMMSFAQQPNVNVSMSYMNMLEAGNQVNLPQFEGDFMELNIEDVLEAGNQVNLPQSEGDFIEPNIEGVLEADNQVNLPQSEGDFIGLNIEDAFDIFDDEEAEFDNAPSGSKRKRMQRHNEHQIKSMESFFEHCPRPDDKQRMQLAKELGLKPLQVKFWFQNKRTQVKAQQERAEIVRLRTENDNLKIEKLALEEALRNSQVCRNCGGENNVDTLAIDEQSLMIENQRLREENNRLSGIASRLVGRPYLTFPDGVPMLVPRADNQVLDNLSEQPVAIVAQQETRDVFLDSGRSADDAEKLIRHERALKAMTELMVLATIDEPLWVLSNDGATMGLNYDEYFVRVPNVMPLPGLKYVASRARAVVRINCMSLVEMFMNVNQWSTVFSSIVPRAQNVEVLSNGMAGTYDGIIHVVAAEFQLPTPIVPTQSSYIARYCKKHLNGRIWVIADVSIGCSHPTPSRRFHCQPSGCLIEAMADGYSKVTWVEHVEVNDRLVHQLFKPVVNSSLAFGAQRWLGTLVGQCDKRASVSASISFSNLANMGTNQDGRRSLMKLASKLVKSYNQGVSSTTAQRWTVLAGSGADNVRIMSRKSIGELGRPIGVVLCASTSFWIPVPPNNVLNYLCNVQTRGQWDFYCNFGGRTEEIVQLGTGREATNCVSLLRFSGSTDARMEKMMIIQETRTDTMGSYVIFAPCNERAIGNVLAGQDKDDVQILPSGISILPDGTRGLAAAAAGRDINATGGSLITVAFQILADRDPNARITFGGMASINGLITWTVDRIKAIVTESDDNVVNNNAQIDGLMNIHEEN